MPPRRERPGPGHEEVTAPARVDTRTKRLVKRIHPGDIMVIDHDDLDRVAAETIIEARAGAVVNASPSISGRYPNVGPLLLCAAGIPLVDGVGREVLDLIAESQVVTVAGGEVLVEGKVVARGERLTMQLVEERIAEARRSMGVELERFAENTLSYLGQERHLLLDEPDIPQIDLRHARPPRADRRAWRRLQGRPRHPPPQRLPRRDEAPAHRGRRRRRRAARDRTHARPDHRRHGLGVRGGAALRGGARGARLPRRAGARFRTTRRPRPRPRPSTRPRGPARTSPCCCPTRRAQS